jgi:hypothetical protein
MTTRLPPRRPVLPLVVRRASSDEYDPVPYNERDLRVVARLRAESPERARRLGMSLAEFWAGRSGTAGALRAVNEAWGGGFYDIPAEAASDPEAAAAALGGDGLVIDVQTHYVAPHRAEAPAAAAVLGFIQNVAPDRWKGLDKMTGFGLAEYLRYVFLESETAIAVLTSAPGDEKRNILTNDEIAGTRELVDRLAGTGGSSTIRSSTRTARARSMGSTGCATAAGRSPGRSTPCTATSSRWTAAAAGGWMTTVSAGPSWSAAASWGCARSAPTKGSAAWRRPARRRTSARPRRRSRTWPS